MCQIRCIGYDMDYTLIHYKVTEWEGRAYMYAKENLKQVRFQIKRLVFDPYPKPERRNPKPCTGGPPDRQPCLGP